MLSCNLLKFIIYVISWMLTSKSNYNFFFFSFCWKEKWYVCFNLSNKNRMWYCMTHFAFSSHDLPIFVIREGFFLCDIRLELCSLFLSNLAPQRRKCKMGKWEKGRPQMCSLLGLYKLNWKERRKGFLSPGWREVVCGI